MTVWLLLLALAQEAPKADPKCESRKPGLAAPECTTYGTLVDRGRPFVTCRAACYLAKHPDTGKARADGGTHPFVVRDEVAGPNTPETRAACRARLERQATNGCRKSLDVRPDVD